MVFMFKSEISTKLLSPDQDEYVKMRILDKKYGLCNSGYQFTVVPEKEGIVFDAPLFR